MWAWFANQYRCFCSRKAFTQLSATVPVLEEEEEEEENYIPGETPGRGHRRQQARRHKQLPFNRQLAIATTDMQANIQYCVGLFLAHETKLGILYIIGQ